MSLTGVSGARQAWREIRKRGGMKTRTITDERFAERFRGQVRGAVTTSVDAGYDEARTLWNGTTPRRPAVIIRARDAKDVAAAVNVAREAGVPIGVSGGRHNVAGNAMPDGAVVIDLRDMRTVTVDAEARRVRVQGGALLGDIDKATRPYNLAVPVGVATETGIGGLALGGGLGWLRRKHGLTVDNLVSAQVVLADGRTVRASEQEQADLFWALRGGGGNFGVVTEFEFRAHPVGPQVVVLAVFTPAEQARDGLRFWREYMSKAPDELSSFAIFWAVPDAELFAEHARGREALIFLSAWCGDPDEGERVIAPLRGFTEPLADLSGRWDYATELQTFFDEDYPVGGRYYWKSRYFDTLSDEIIETLIDFAGTRPSKASSVDIWHLGGAIARVPADATPVPQRHAQFLLGIESNWSDAGADAENIAWAREFYAAASAHSPQGVYVNFPGFGEEGVDLVRAAYGENYARLARIKAQYDPQNLFRFNQNIRPE